MRVFMTFISILVFFGVSLRSYNTRDIVLNATVIELGQCTNGFLIGWCSFSVKTSNKTEIWKSNYPVSIGQKVYKECYKLGNKDIKCNKIAILL